MKIYNWTLLTLALLIAVPDIPVSLRHQNLAEGIFLLWLVSIPAISLISLSYGKGIRKNKTLLFGASYNGISAMVFLVYAIGTNTSNSHPVAFAVVSMMFAFFLAMVVGINVILFYRAISRNRTSNMATQEGQPPPSATP